MATAYTIRYGRAKAEGGPSEGGTVSDSAGFGDAPRVLGDGEGTPPTGGGSIDDKEGGALDGRIGSGSGAMSSEVEEVSIVICFVVAGSRKLKKVGQHRTATDGFLCPGRCAIGGLFKPARL